MKLYPAERLSPKYLICHKRLRSKTSQTTAGVIRTVWTAEHGREDLIRDYLRTSRGTSGRFDTCSIIGLEFILASLNLAEN